VLNIFKPDPYGIIISTLVVIPFLLLLLIPLSGRRIVFDITSSSLYPSMLNSFMVALGVLVLRGVVGYELLHWKQAIVPILCAVLLLFIVFLTVHIGEKLPKETRFAALFLCLLYGLGASLTVNGIGRRELVSAHRVEILDKRKSSGKTTTYYFKVSPWGERQDSNDVRVGSQRYNEYDIHDTATVRVYKGRLGIEFYVVR
jgi:hypothetical protein